MKINKKRLTKNFFERDTQVVARELLGKVLVHHVNVAHKLNTSFNDKIISGRITEVESYVGEDDLACHAARGRTARTEIMYGQPGHAYIYLIYGMYHCLNFVTEQTGFPAAVLIRALDPLEGIPAMEGARQTDVLTQLTTGPGKLTQALNITRDLNGVDITASSELYVVDDGFSVTADMITSTTRIGVDYAGPCALYPWRYYLRDSQFVSKR